MSLSSLQGKILHEALQDEHAALGLPLELLEYVPSEQNVIEDAHAAERAGLEAWLQRSIRQEDLWNVVADLLQHSHQGFLYAFLHDCSLSCDPARVQLIQDIQTYREILLEQMEQHIDQEYVCLIPFFEDWKQLVTHLVRHQAGVQLSNSFQMDLDQLNQEWEAVEPAQQVVLRPLLLHYTSVVGYTFALPEWFAERATPYLVTM